MNTRLGNNMKYRIVKREYQNETLYVLQRKSWFGYRDVIDIQNTVVQDVYLDLIEKRMKDFIDWDNRNSKRYKETELSRS